MPLILLGFWASLAAGVATGVGAVPVLFTKRAPEWLMDALLGFAAGVMLAAIAFSLLMPALELGGILATTIGLAAGALFLALLGGLCEIMSVKDIDDGGGFDMGMLLHQMQS